jgi:hypothetical protein
MTVSSQLASAIDPKEGPSASRTLRSVAPLGAPVATGAKYLWGVYRAGGVGTSFRLGVGNEVVRGASGVAV